MTTVSSDSKKPGKVDPRKEQEKRRRALTKARELKYPSESHQGQGAQVPFRNFLRKEEGKVTGGWDTMLDDVVDLYVENPKEKAALNPYILDGIVRVHCALHSTFPKEEAPVSWHVKVLQYILKTARKLAAEEEAEEKEARAAAKAEEKRLREETKAEEKRIKEAAKAEKEAAKAEEKLRKDLERLHKEGLKGNGLVVAQAFAIDSDASDQDLDSLVTVRSEGMVVVKGERLKRKAGDGGGMKKKEKRRRREPVVEEGYDSLAEDS
eukprot:3662276-Rhodomonas_salina.2